MIRQKSIKKITIQVNKEWNLNRNPGKCEESLCKVRKNDSGNWNRTHKKLRLKTHIFINVDSEINQQIECIELKLQFKN